MYLEVYCFWIVSTYCNVRSKSHYMVDSGLTSLWLSKSCFYITHGFRVFHVFRVNYYWFIEHTRDEKWLHFTIFVYYCVWVSLFFYLEIPLLMSRSSHILFPRTEYYTPVSSGGNSSIHYRLILHLPTPLLAMFLSFVVSVSGTPFSLMSKFLNFPSKWYIGLVCLILLLTFLRPRLGVSQDFRSNS